ncbi:MAG: TonB-dependent receptor [Bacteroidota bacterium]
MKSIALIAVLAISFALAFSQESGTIRGIVRDADSHEPLESANVVVRGTFLGAATDRNGTFRISGLSRGRYTVVVSMVGYRPFPLEGIEPGVSDAKPIEVFLQSVPIETEQIIVTASRRAQDAREVPVSMAVITATALAARNNVTVDDALRYVPGVNMVQDQVNIRGSSGYSRGVGSRVLLLLDGLPFLTGDTGEINWETLPIGEIERIEIVKGAGSALYGSSALGGVINVLTRPLPDKPVFRFRMFSGLYDNPPYDEWRWSEKPRFNSGVMLGYADRIGSLQYLVSGGRTVNESHKANDAYHRWTLFTKAKYDLSEESSLSMVFNMLRRTHGNFFWWKSLREATTPADAQRNGSVESTRGNLSLGFRQTLSENLFYVVKGMYFGNFWKDDSAGHVNNVSASHVVQGDAQVTYGISEGNILTVGIAGNLDQVESNLFGRHKGFGIAAYLQEEVRLTKDLQVTAGIRYDVQKASVLSSKGRLSPKLGLTFVISDATVLRGSLGTGFRYPSIGELFISTSTNVSQLIILPNLNLRPETSVTAELGVSTRVTEVLEIDGAVFWNEFRNLIEPSVKIKSIRLMPTDTVESDRAVVEFDNVVKARIQGAEIGLKISWWKKVLTTDFGYTVLWPEDVGERAVLKFRPRHMVHVSAAWAMGDLRCSADYRFISRMDRIDDQLVVLGPIVHGQFRVPIHVVDVRGSIALSPWGLPLQIGLNVNNALNYQYVELIGNLASPRMFSLSIEGYF